MTSGDSIAATAVPTGGRITEGMDTVRRLVRVDQKPIGRTPRSNLATYTGLFDHVRKLFADTPLARAKRRGLLRNVCVALGNVGTSAARPALERATHDPEPLIAEHARWAAGQIETRALTRPAR